LHPRNAAPAALSSLQQWLQAFQAYSFKLHYMTDRWIAERLITPAQIMWRLFEICCPEATGQGNGVEPSRLCH
jgi:hypothetical protein